MIGFSLKSDPLAAAEKDADQTQPDIYQLQLLPPPPPPMGVYSSLFFKRGGFGRYVLTFREVLAFEGSKHSGQQKHQ